MLDTCGHNIDACGVYAAVSENTRQLGDILFNAAKGPGKELAQIVGEYLACLDACGLAQLLHLPPDAAAVQRFSAFVKKNRTGMEAPLLGVIQQLLFQLARNQNGPGFAFAVDCYFPGAYGFHGEIPQLGNPNSGSTNGLNHQI